MIIQLHLISIINYKFRMSIKMGLYQHIFHMCFSPSELKKEYITL